MHRLAAICLLAVALAAGAISLAPTEASGHVVPCAFRAKTVDHPFTTVLSTSSDVLCQSPIYRIGIRACIQRLTAPGNYSTLSCNPSSGYSYSAGVAYKNVNVTATCVYGFNTYRNRSYDELLEDGVYSYGNAYGSNADYFC